MRAAPSSSSAASRALPGAGEPRRSLHLHRHQPLLPPSRGVPAGSPVPTPAPRGERVPWGRSSPLVALRKDTGHGHHRHPVPGGGLRLGPPALLKGRECAGELWVPGCSSCSPREHSSARQETLGILQLPAPTRAGLEPGEVPRTTAAAGKRTKRIQAQAPVGQGQPMGAAVGGEQLFILPPQRAPALPQPPRSGDEELMLGVSFFPPEMGENPPEIWVRPRLPGEQFQSPDTAVQAGGGTSSHQGGPACAPAGSRTLQLPCPQL